VVQKKKLRQQHQKKKKQKQKKQKQKRQKLEAKEVVIYQNKVEIGEQLTAFAAAYTEETGVKVTIKTSGGDSPYAEALKAEFQSDRQPDIFVIEGMGGYNTWQINLAL
jgi:raffinose/stachyose/melibiose transport system substrate-binding protein